MFAPGLLSMIVSLALSSASNLSNIEQQAVDAAKSVQQSAPVVVAPATAAPRMVMTWIQSWTVPDSLAAMKKRYAGVGPSDAITHIGIQGWLPTMSGGVEKDSPEVSDAEIKKVTAWAHQHGIKVVLCVYNNVGGGTWDWNLAKSAFSAGGGATFADALVAEMNRLKLDGVDIDLEGDNQFDGDKDAYVAFVTALRAKLAAGKHLTVDSFPYQWNAPNWTWWTSIFPHVDGITSMGYQDMGMNGPPPWQSYANQVAQAGTHANKLMLGMDASFDTWQGNTPAQQTNWVVTHKKVNVSIWEARFTGTAWQKPAVWKNLKTLRDGQ